MSTLTLLMIILLHILIISFLMKSIFYFLEYGKLKDISEYMACIIFLMFFTVSFVLCVVKLVQ